MSGPTPEPQAPTFERLRQIAKQLARACRAGDPAALVRVRARLPRLAAMDEATAASHVRLADVHHALAREAGVDNWAALKALVQAQEPLVEQLKRFVRALHDGDAATMRRVLDSHPEVARTSIHAACVACDADAVGRWLAKNPATAVAPFAGGGWTPIECVAASPLVTIDDDRRRASVAIAERLLALGADPNAFTLAADCRARLTALYRASERGNAGIVKLLLDRGVNPNDGESVYHAAEHDHRDVLALLVAHGAEISAAHQPWNNTVLYFLCGYREGQPGARAATLGMQWLLEHGADPNVPSYAHRSTPLHAIAAQGRGADVARMLLAHGADPRRARADGRTPYELAMRAGNVAVAEVLREAGGAAPLRAIDAVLAACAGGDTAAVRRELDADPGLREALLRDEPDALVHAAGHGSAAAIPVLAALGYALAREGGDGGTALHHAAWRGQVEAVRALLAAGAPIDPRDRTFGSSPIAWAAHGSANCREADDDYIGVIDLLLAAGAGRDVSFNRWNEPPESLASDAVADHLRARGFAPEA